MSSVDSKFTKSLQIHTLENIVYEKRQRKTVTQQPITNLNVPHNNKNVKSKKIKKNNQIEQVHKTNKPKLKRQSKSVQTPKKQKIIKKRKYITSKDLIKPKNKKNLTNKKSQQISLKKPNVISNLTKLNQNQKQSQIKIKQAQKNAQTQKVITLKSQKKSQLKIQKQLKEEKPEIQQVENKQKQIQLTPKKLGRPRKPVIVFEQNQNEKDLSNVQDIEKNNLRRSPVKSRALANILDSASKKQLIEADQTPKPRQAKLNALKKYTQKQLYPQDSFENEKDFSNKRKRISKTNRPDNYSINRIFRKQPKLNLIPINIEVKLDKLNLNSFQQKFGTFDIIHCSLPLSMIWQLSSIQNLMVKGFIFLWVEKGQTALAYHLMKKLGYDVIDQIVWVKCDEATKTVFNQPYPEEETTLSQNNLFLNSKSVCFVGYKCPTGQKAQYRTKISNNLIFSCPKFNEPIKKPEQIYEIADLLMPGSKKLQLGGKKQNGWLSLHHNELRLRKCSICLMNIQQNLGRMFQSEISNQISSICESCYKISLKQKEDDSVQSDQEESLNSVQNIKENISIKEIRYLDQEINNICIKCQNSNCEQTITCSCNVYSQQKLCKQCFSQNFVSHLTHSIDSINVKKHTFLPSAHLSCSSCNKSTLCSHFYQCTASGCRTKNHLLCQQCFWKCGYEMIQNENQINEPNKKKNDGLHEFKLRKICQTPEQRVSCSCACKKDLQLPHFICETCVGWRWCGKCKLNDDDLHEINTQSCENQDRKHLLSLIG